jgi:hypothetical protein
MKVQGPADEFNPLHAVSSGSDLARNSSTAALHYNSPVHIRIIILAQPKWKIHRAVRISAAAYSAVLCSAVSDREPVNSIFNANRKAQDGIVLRFSNRNLLNVNH